MTQDDQRRRLAALAKPLDDAGFDHDDGGGDDDDPCLIIFSGRPSRGIAIVRCVSVDPPTYSVHARGVGEEVADADRTLALLDEWRSGDDDPEKALREQIDAIDRRQMHALHIQMPMIPQLELLDEIIAAVEPGRRSVPLRELRERADELRAAIDAAKAEDRACSEEGARLRAERQHLRSPRRRRRRR